MALTPGGGRSPSTQRPPSPTRTPTPSSRTPRPGGRKPLWTRAASMSVLRLGLLFGGLVIIADLGAMSIIERTASADEIAAWDQLDQLVNYVLFSLLGVLVVRDTGIMWAGAVAGIFASLLDAIVVTAASLMVPPPQTLDMLEVNFALNLIIGTVFAGLSGVVFAVVQRWSGGQRSR